MLSKKCAIFFRPSAANAISSEKQARRTVTQHSFAFTVGGYSPGPRGAGLVRLVDVRVLREQQPAALSRRLGQCVVAGCDRARVCGSCGRSATAFEQGAIARGRAQTNGVLNCHASLRIVRASSRWRKEHSGALRVACDRSKQHARCVECSSGSPRSHARSTEHTALAPLVRSAPLRPVIIQNIVAVFI